MTLKSPSVSERQLS